MLKRPVAVSHHTRATKVALRSLLTYNVASIGGAIMIYDLERIAKSFTDQVPGKNGLPNIGDYIRYGNDDKNQFVYGNVMEVIDGSRIRMMWAKGSGSPFHGQKVVNGEVIVMLAHCQWQDGTNIMRSRTPNECAELVRSYIKNLSVGDC